MQTPWTLGTDEDFPEGNAALIGPDGEQVATVWNTSDPKQKERAEFIARACNCHEDLLQTLKSVLFTADMSDDGESTYLEISRECADEIRAAIAKATR